MVEQQYPIDKKSTKNIHHKFIIHCHSAYFKGCKSPDFGLSFWSFPRAGGLRSMQVPTRIKRGVNRRGNCFETNSVISSDQNSS